MSALPAIEVQAVRKRYVIGGRSDDYSTLRDAVAGILLAPFRRLAGRAPPEEHHWALDGVSFQVAPGEVVGVVGRNGAGKSTLLKVLSRITEPTEGRVVVRGRVGSLLEVGTGFHPELSGRENIFLNGAILGMRRVEIARKFDEIVAFSEVAKFVDTPVKHYSSGMYLRLAFAVAAHLEPEVLLIDEVLAVGDVAFQKKCIGKMDDVAKQGRTVLFVSHNMAAIRTLCSRTVVIEGGRVAFDGPSVEGIRRYQELLAAAPTDQAGDKSVFGGFTIDGSTDLAVDPDRPFTLKFRMRVPVEVARPQLYCNIDDTAGNLLVHDRLDLEETLAPGLRDVEVTFPALWLRTGPYGVTLRLHGMAGLTNGRWAAEKRMLDVRSKPELGGGKLDGLLAAATTWSIRPAEDP